MAGILQYAIPEEKEEYVVAAKPDAMDIDIDPALATVPQEPRSNLRLPPPPLFSRQTIPQIYKLRSIYSLYDKRLTVNSYKKNPASVETSFTDQETGEEKKRLINRMRWKGFGPTAINFADLAVSTGNATSSSRLMLCVGGAQPTFLYHRGTAHSS